MNLRLDVLGKRDDGYHDILSLMQLIDLSDGVEVSLSKKGIEVSCSSPQVPEGKDNLAYRAAQTYLSTSGFRRGVRIAIEKRIPVGAGLGGGSSNAATILMALQNLSGNAMSTEDLLRLARGIGADVPYFLLGRPAWVSGIGDVSAQVTMTFPLWYVLVYPGFSISTRWAYEELDTFRSSRGLTKNKPDINIEAKKEFTDLEELVGVLHNDLEEVSLSTYPEIGRAKHALLAEGARGVLMTGSGSTVFGLFPDKMSAQDASRRIQKKGWEVYSAEGLGSPV